MHGPQLRTERSFCDWVHRLNLLHACSYAMFLFARTLPICLSRLRQSEHLRGRVTVQLTAPIKSSDKARKKSANARSLTCTLLENIHIILETTALSDRTHSGTVKHTSTYVSCTLNFFHLLIYYSYIMWAKTYSSPYATFVSKLPNF